MHTEDCKPTHRQHHPLHDYRERCIYHITLVCSNRAQVFGQIIGQSPDTAICDLTPLGMAISNEIQQLPSRCSAKGRKVQVLAKVIMPEHLHMVLFIQEPMDCRLQLILRGFKQGCNKRLRQWLQPSATQPSDVQNVSTPYGTVPSVSTPVPSASTPALSASTPYGTVPSASSTEPSTARDCPPRAVRLGCLSKAVAHSSHHPPHSFQPCSF